MNMRGWVVMSILLLIPTVALADIVRPPAASSVPLLTPGAARGETDVVRPPDASPEVQQRFGVDGLVTMGIVIAKGGSMRFEQRVKSEGYLTVRAGLYQGFLIADDDGAGDFYAPVGSIGYRGYWGNLYLAIEGGIAGIRQHRWVDDDNDHHGVSWFPLPSASLAVGGKLGVFDLGVTTGFPFVGIGAYLGFDLARL